MAGTKDNAVVAVIGDLTNEQAAQMTKEIRFVALLSELKGIIF